MPAVTPLQSNFSVGEVAPDVQLRYTLDERNKGVRTLTNFNNDSHGPIIRRRGFRFLGVVGEASDICAQAQYFQSFSGLPSFGAYNIDKSDTLNYVAMSSAMPGNEATGNSLVVFDESGTVVQTIGGCSRFGHKIISRFDPLPEFVDTWIARTNWSCGVTNRFIIFNDMADGFSQLDFEDFGLDNIRIRAERNTDIFVVNETQSGVCYTLDKPNYTIGPGLQTITAPGGWTVQGAAAFNKTGPFNREDRYLVCLNNGTQFGFIEYTSGGTLGTPTVLLAPVDGDDFVTLKSNPVVVNDQHIWWQFDTGQAGKIREYLIRTDTDGSNQVQIPMFDDLIIGQSGSGDDRLYYESENNSIYYMETETLWRYDITANTYHQCLPPYADGISITPPVRSQAMVRLNGFHWNMLEEEGAGPDTWGAEKIEARF